MAEKNVCKEGTMKRKKVGIIDADLLGRKKHRFPNLACEKISAYWKEKGAEVTLLLNYDDMNLYDEIYVSKVFTDTPYPKELQGVKNIHLGGTGFFYDKAPNLPEEIEHHFPDYNLYNDWINQETDKAEKETEKSGIVFNRKKYLNQFKEYLDYSIGFLTRGCFRKCEFCVNKKYDYVSQHSALNEFLDSRKRKICLLDDNFLGSTHWRSLLSELIETGKSFKFKQGLDERLLTDEKCRLLFNSKYDGDFTFAFDKISDFDLIHEKLKLIRKHSPKSSVKFYILVGFESVDHNDIENAFKRIEVILKYGCIPYIMRYQNINEIPWKESSLRSLYVAIARWCNQPSLVKKMSFRQFCEANQAIKKDKTKICSTLSAMKNFEENYPKIAKKYFDIRMEDIKKH